MKTLTAIGLLLVATLIQSLMGSSLIFDSRPDLTFIVVIAWSLLRGSGSGALVGFTGGLLLDSISETPFGVYSALLGIAGYLAGWGEGSVYRVNVPLFALIGIGATLIYHTASFMILQALGPDLPPVIRNYELAVPAAVMNAVLLVPVFVGCRSALRNLTGWREIQV